jgi:hypothetical protein
VQHAINRRRYRPEPPRQLASSAHQAHRIRGVAVMVAAAPGHIIVFGKRAMIAMQLTGPDLLRRQTPADRPATVTAQFQLLDPGVVNEAIPAFFIGRNKEGFWVARDVKGRIGGIFLFENSAVSFARKNSRPAGCATIYPSERFELDLEDKGNLLVARLVSMLRLTMRPRQRMAGFIDRAVVQAVKRRLLGTVTILAATGALAAVIALKTAIYLSRFSY